MTSQGKHVKRPRVNPEFYNCPDAFSFKDLLAIVFTMGFFYACFRALSHNQALELVKTITYLMAIILGGYFGHEITAAIIHEKYKTNNSYQNDYSNVNEDSAADDETEAQV